MRDPEEEQYAHHHRTRLPGRGMNSPLQEEYQEDRDVYSQQSEDAFEGKEETASHMQLYALLGVGKEATGEEIKKAYKSLVATLHPDKMHHQDDEEVRQAAKEHFIRIQEAYDVLSNPETRDVYDVYGLEGVRSGLELSVFDGSSMTEEKKRRWEFYQSQKKKMVEEAMSSQQKGVYIFKTDASSLFTPYAPANIVSRVPQVTHVYISSGMDIPIGSSEDSGLSDSDQDSLHLGGMVTVRDGIGGGSFVAGYHRFYSNGAQGAIEGSVGLQTLLGFQASIPMYSDQDSTIFASGGCSWSPDSGVAFDVGTTCQLGPQTSGEFTWTLFPQELSSMAISIKHKIDSTLFVAKAEVGAITGLTIRLIHQLTNSLSGRLSLKAGTQGVECEVGGNRRLSQTSSSGMSVITGLQGVLLRLRFQKGGHNFEFPFILSTILDPWIIVCAHVVPPLAVTVFSQFLMSPIYKRYRSKRAHQEEAMRIKHMEADKKEATTAQNIIKPVAIRKMEKAMKEDSLVILKALYGDSSLVSEMQVQVMDSILRSGAFEIQDTLSVIDVTVPVQYMCDSGRVIFHSGYPKANLFGFYDPVPTVPKMLFVLFKYQGQNMKACLEDREGGILPTKGVPLEIDA